MQDPPFQQLSDEGIELRQGPTQPAQLRGGFFRHRLPVSRPCVAPRAGGGGQLLEQRSRTLAILAAAARSIEAAHRGDRRQFPHLPEQLRRTAERLGQGRLPQRGQTLAAALLLQLRLPLPQFPEAARYPHQVLAVPQFVQDGALDVGNRQGAELGLALRIKGFDRPHQPQTSHLNEVVEGEGSLAGKTAGDGVHQWQVVRHQGIAPDPPPPWIVAAGVGQQPALVALLPLLCGLGFGVSGGHAGQRTGIVPPSPSSPSATSPERATPDPPIG